MTGKDVEIADGILAHLSKYSHYIELGGYYANIYQGERVDIATRLRIKKYLLNNGFADLKFDTSDNLRITEKGREVVNIGGIQIFEYHQNDLMVAELEKEKKKEEIVEMDHKLKKAQLEGVKQDGELREMEYQLKKSELRNKRLMNWMIILATAGTVAAALITLFK